jgi:hypothetical protein
VKQNSDRDMMVTTTMAETGQQRRNRNGDGDMDGMVTRTRRRLGLDGDKDEGGERIRDN